VDVGLVRPISLFPFPTQRVSELAQRIGKVLTVEMSMGQMVEDVRAAVGNDIPVDFFGHTGGIVPSPDEVAEQIRKRL
jgi:2-oxoglutarate ferredoxin oxidoreductase subunit alpha